MDWPVIYLIIMIAFVIAVTLIVFWLRQPSTPPRGFDLDGKRDEKDDAPGKPGG